MPFFLPNPKPAVVARPEPLPSYLEAELSQKKDGKSQLTKSVRRNRVRFVTNDWDRARLFVHPPTYSTPSFDLIQMVRLGESVLHSKTNHARRKGKPFSSTTFT